MLAALLEDLSRQRGIENWLVVLTLNIPETRPSAGNLRLDVVENNDPRGFGENHNRAFERAEGPVFVIVNPDIRLPDLATLEMLAEMDWQRPVLRAPVIVSPAGEIEDSVRHNLTPWNLAARAFGRREPAQFAPQRRFVWFAGMFLAVSSAAFRKLGGFDQRFFLYCEDYDLCLRWKLSGGVLEQLEALRVVHDAQRDSHRSARHLRWHIQSLLKVWTSSAFWQLMTANIKSLRGRSMA